MNNEELQSLLNSSQANQNQLKTKVQCPFLLTFYSVHEHFFLILHTCVKLNLCTLHLYKSSIYMHISRV